MIPRPLYSEAVSRALLRSPVTALLGPRKQLWHPGAVRYAAHEKITMLPLAEIGSFLE